MKLDVLQALQKIEKKIVAGELNDEKQVAKEIAKILDQVESIGSDSLPKFSKSEPPIIEKYIDIVERIDSTIKYQSIALTLLKALTVLDFNYSQRLMVELENKVSGLWDTYLTLQFYLNSPAMSGLQNIFFNYQGLNPRIDTSWSSLEKRLSIRRDVGMSLPIISNDLIPIKDITYEGNGFLGRLHTVDSSGNPYYTVKSYDKGKEIIDLSPETWVEYETFKVSNDIWSETKGYGWKYHEAGLEPWASPYVQWLDLKLTIFPKRSTPINMIVINPLLSSPYTIRKVQLDLGNGTLRTLEPQDLVVTPEISEHRFADKAGMAVYVFDDVAVEKIFIEIRQSKSEPCQVLHRYYVDPSGNRINGPDPSQYKPTSMDIAAKSSTWERKLEYLSAERFFIGIKDISLYNCTYTNEGFTVNEPVKFSKDIDRVAVETEEIIQSGTSIKYAVSVDGGTTWISLTPIGSSTRNQVVAINDRRPDTYRDPSTIYAEVKNPLKELIFKTEMQNKSSSKNRTPILKTANLKVTLK
jgi:hypothetical protein